MSKLILSLFFSIYFTFSALCQINSTMPAMPPQTKENSSLTQISTDEINYNNIMTMCNETFKISLGINKFQIMLLNLIIKLIVIDYLSELNSTGSFPDETDKTPMVSVLKH